MKIYTLAIGFPFRLKELMIPELCPPHLKECCFILLFTFQLLQIY